jgi:hypothetical protein
LGVHADAFTRQPFCNFTVAIQAERYEEIGIMPFADDVMFFKKTI